MKPGLLSRIQSLFSASSSVHVISPSDNIKFDTAVGPSTTPAQVPRVSPAVLQYAQDYSGGRHVFIAPEYELTEIGVIEDVDGIVRQAFKKKFGLMFKEGFSFVGSNRETVQYYKNRMAQIAQASGIPTSELLRRVALSLIRTSNAFLVKVRSEDASGGLGRTDPNGKAFKPVAAYFPAAPETMRVDLDQESGKIVGWRQQLPSGKYRDFRAEDVVHFFIDRREGFIFGVPTIVPVIDDIRALRQIEEHVELLIYQHIFPMFHYIVGTEQAPAGYTESGEHEVEIAKREVRMMPSEGGIITPERHEIRLIGAEGRALRAETYLDYFKKRVIAGLGISEIDLGSGDTANRATANTLSRALIDSVKDIQDSLEAQWDQNIISEILLESDFGNDVLNEENLVHLQFAEIDLDNQIEREKHAIELFKSSGVTYSEFRTLLSRDPLQLPEDPNDQDPSKYKEWMQTYWKLIEEPSLLIRAVDEPYSAQAKAAASAPGSSITQKGLDKSQSEQEKALQREAEQERKTKIAVAKAKPKTPVRKDHYLSTTYSELEEDTVKRVISHYSTTGRYSKEYINANIRAWGSSVSDFLVSKCSSSMISGFNSLAPNKAHLVPGLIHSGRKAVSSYATKYIDRLVDSIIAELEKRINPDLPGELGIQQNVNELHNVFSSLRYRTDFILDTELRRSFNYGKLLAMRFSGIKTAVTVTTGSSCDSCHAETEREIDVATARIDEIAPHHPNCNCNIKIKT